MNNQSTNPDKGKVQEQVRELQKFLVDKFPMATAMGVQVLDIDAVHGARLAAPLELNKNHMGTAFGGSLDTLMIFACYSWLHLVMERERFDARVVIKRNEIEYRFPVTEDLVARIEAPSPETTQQIVQQYRERQRGRLVLAGVIETKDGIACRMQGEFILRPKTDPLQTFRSSKA